MKKIFILVLSIICLIKPLSAVNNQNQLKTLESKMNTNAMSDLLFNLSFNFMVSRALYVAADLQIADILAQEPCNLEQLAIKTVTDAPSLERLMRLLGLYNIFIISGETYQNTELSELMRSDHPESVRPLLLHEDETRWNSHGHLGYSIKTGKPAFDHLYEMPYFEYTSKHPVLNERFNKAMTVISETEETSIARSFDFSKYKTVADIGGGRGGNLAKILKAHSNVHGMLIDLPDVVTEHAPLSPFAGRYTVQAGSFFEPISVKADLYILKRILHDWDDEKSITILKNIAQAMSDDSRLLIIDAHIGGEGKKAQFISQVDLILLAVFGGKERTEEDFKKIIHASGLEVVTIHETDTMVSLIECKVPSTVNL